MHLSHKMVRSAQEAANLNTALSIAAEMNPYKQAVHRAAWLSLLLHMRQVMKRYPDTNACLRNRVLFQHKFTDKQKDIGVADHG